MSTFSSTSSITSTPMQTNIKVCVRVRPITTRGPPVLVPEESSEMEERSATRSPLMVPGKVLDVDYGGKTSPTTTTIECWSLTSSTITPNLNYTSPLLTLNQAPSKRIAYSFDHLFPPLTKTKALYNNAVRSVVVASMEGYHGSVFAYGQTSTGKTYTMQGTGENPGVVPLAICNCFDYIQNKGLYKNGNGGGDREFLLRVSYMEIYNEQINDLLSPESMNSVRIYEHKGKGVIVRGMKEEVVISPNQVFSLIAKGEESRHVGSTDMNAASSRSHTIFRLLIESKARGDSNNNNVRVSTLSLVDLAGSESVKLAGTSGHRLNEGKFINKSLLTLGHVIWKLSENSRKSDMDTQHIPYRDSKLTRLLQPSLGGNAQISIICNISPSVIHLEETHNTLKFASRAKRIKQSATLTEVLDDRTLLMHYREEIEVLRKQLNELHLVHIGVKSELDETNNNNYNNNNINNSSSSKEEREEEGEDEEETQAIVTAIHNLERLILRNDPSQGGKTPANGDTPTPKFVGNGNDNSNGIGGVKGKLFFGSRNESSIDKDENDEPITPDKVAIKTPIYNELGDDKDKNIDDFKSALTVDVDALMLPNTDNSTLVNELQRVQGLLGAVLEKKSNRRVTMTSSTPTRSGLSNGGFTSPQLQATHSSGDNDELTTLKNNIKKLDNEKMLHRADISFLEQALYSKDSMLTEVAAVLDAVEVRIYDLEKENGVLKNGGKIEGLEKKNKDLVKSLNDVMHNSKSLTAKLEVENADLIRSNERMGGELVEARSKVDVLEKAENSNSRSSGSRDTELAEAAQRISQLEQLKFQSDKDNSDLKIALATAQNLHIERKEREGEVADFELEEALNRSQELEDENAELLDALVRGDELEVANAELDLKNAEMEVKIEEVNEELNSLKVKNNLLEESLKESLMSKLETSEDGDENELIKALSKNDELEVKNLELEENVEKLRTILEAREKELLGFKGVDAGEEMF